MLPRKGCQLLVLPCCCRLASRHHLLHEVNGLVNAGHLQGGFKKGVSNMLQMHVQQLKLSNASLLAGCMAPIAWSSSPSAGLTYTWNCKNCTCNICQSRQVQIHSATNQRSLSHCITN